MKNKMVPTFSCILVIVMTVITGASCNPSRELPPTNKDFIRYASGVSFRSELYRSNMVFDILLPADYIGNTEKRYPVVYMLHGYGDNNTSWNGQYLTVEQKIKSLEEKGLEPMIYVFPNGFNSYYCNTFDGSKPYMDMFTEELVPYIDKTYRTIPDRRYRATLGYSMGGFGAMILPLKHKELFSVSVPLSMSFRTDEQYITEPQSGWDRQWGKIFGGVGLSGEDRLTDYYKEHCPFYQFTSANAGQLSDISWFLHCGDDEEQLLIANDALHIQMRNNDIPHEYRVADGAHTSTYWRNSLDEVLPFIASKFNGEKVWNKAQNTPEISEVILDDNGNYISEAFSSSTPGTTLLFLATEFSSNLNMKIISILARGLNRKNFVIIPFNPLEITVNQIIRETEAAYNVTGDRQCIAFGKVAPQVFAESAQFSRLYFDNAKLTGNSPVSTIKDNFYYIGQTDDGLFYKDMGGLYLFCKTNNIPFDYRVRNGLGDEEKDALCGAEMIKLQLKFQE